MLTLYISLCIIFIIIGIKVTKNFFNPLTLFNIIWATIVFLYNFQLSKWQDDLSMKTYYVLIINILMFFIGFIFSYKIGIQKNKENNKKLSYGLLQRVFIFWLVIELFETVYSGGLPFLWKIIGSYKTYTEYGIPSLHGLMNSIGLVEIISLWYLYLKEKKKKYLKLITVFFIYYLLIITRQVIISALIEMIIIYLYYTKRVPWKKLICIFIITIFLFGIIGNFRTGYESFLYVSAFKNVNVSKLFIGIYWLYMYLTMTIANINNAVINNISGYGCLPIVKKYLPSVISDMIFGSKNLYLPNIKVTKTFNVSGYFPEFLIGYGIYGVAFIAFIYGLLGGKLLKKFNKNPNEKNILYYSVIIQIILLSFFSNHLLYLPSGFQFIVIWFLFKQTKEKKVNE